MSSEFTDAVVAEPDEPGRLRDSDRNALRRLAQFVAGGATAGELFAAVTQEVAQVVDVEAVMLARYEPDESITVVASVNAPTFPGGGRWPLDGPSLAASILETGRAARFDDYADLGGTIAASVRESELRSTVGVPVVLDGRIWGLLWAGTRDSRRLPADIVSRLTDFAELAVIAISNAASRERGGRVAEEQAALRRVARLVGEAVPLAELFSSVVEEIAVGLGVPTASLLRYEPERMTIVLAAVNAPRSRIGSQGRLDDHPLAALVFENGRAARTDDANGTALGVPIVVDGSLWGLISVAAGRRELLPLDDEPLLRDFTELIATAISSADARERRRRMADEQAALRRVATSVAEGATPTEVFSTVANEVARILDVAAVSIVRYEPDRTSVVVASLNDPSFPVGSRWPSDGPSLNAAVLETGSSAQIDYSRLSGPVAEAARASGMQSGVGVPIVVDGTIWGMIAVGRRHMREGPLPLFAGTYTSRIVLSTESARDTEARLAAFTELVATAISNADAREHLRGLAEEQAALRRVATLVARDAPSTEVFDAVATEVAKLLDTDITVLGRYDDDGAATAIGSWSASPVGVPVGTRSAIGGRNVLTLVAETGKPARVDGYDDASGQAADIARRFGWSSSIAAPVIVEGRLWGVMLVATEGPEPFPLGAEDRLAAFTDMVATAVANAQAHDEVRRFGDEQAALGRVATFVAGGAAPEQVFTAVVDEVSTLLGLERIELVRYDGDATGTVIAASGDHPFAAGSTWSLDDPSVMVTVSRTKRAARIDNYSNLDGEIARTARSAGFQSAIGAPITVEGRLWGVIIAISTDPEPIPERSEARLGRFTNLVATAVANAEARQALERVAAEQAALRRIATLVAKGVQPEEVLAAVTEEVAATFRAMTAVLRFEDDPPEVVLVGASKEIDVPIGSRWDMASALAAAEVYRSGRSARIDREQYSSASEGPIREAVHRLGIISTVASPIIVEGSMWGVITVNAGEELPPDTDQRLEKFTELVTTAIAKAESKAELAASRRRIVAASDETRRRIERDLHDGTQQRLVSLGLAVRAAEANLPPERDDLRAQLSGVATGLLAAVEDLQEISRGIHPAILSKGGLGPALQALAHRSAIPVDLDIATDVRLPEPIEVAAYFVASEVLANATKHSDASRIDVLLEQRDGRLMLSVRDDGVGGADAARGSGLIGLTDRVEALGGTITVQSRPGAGTEITAELPIET
jgi:GAF domain-containing protein